MPTIFDGPNKRIFIDSNEPNVDVRALYSEWKEWVIQANNAAYEQAFSSIGGDPTIPGQTAPSYYFLQNDWKVVIDGFNATFSFNLYSADASSPLITLNNGSAQVFNSDVGIVKSTLDESLDYNNMVIIDQVTGIAGSEYPIGTGAQPVNNFADALTIAQRYGFIKIFLRRGVYLISENLDGYEIDGATPLTCQLQLTNVGSYIGTNFRDLLITGEGSDSDRMQLDRCSLGDFTNFNGFLVQCGLFGTVSASVASDTVMWDCTSQVPGSDSPVIDMRPGLPTRLNLRGYSGGIRVINCDHPDDVATLEFVAGRCRLDSTCSAGTLSVRGSCDLEDNSTGTTVDTTGHLQSLISTVVQGVETRVTDVQDKVIESWKLDGLDPANPKTITDNAINVDNISISVTDDGTTTTVDRS